MNKNKGKLDVNLKKGSSTIEASYLIPFLIIVTMTFIYLAFFLYNRLLVTEVCYLAGLRGSQKEYAAAEEVYDEVCKQCDQLMQGKLLSIDSYDRQVQVQGKHITVTLKIAQKIPFKNLVLPFTGKETLTYQAKEKLVIQNPYQFIRDCRRISQ